MASLSAAFRCCACTYIEIPNIVLWQVGDCRFCYVLIYNFRKPIAHITRGLEVAVLRGSCFNFINFFCRRVAHPLLPKYLGVLCPHYHRAHTFTKHIKDFNKTSTAIHVIPSQYTVLTEICCFEHSSVISMLISALAEI